MKRNIIITGGDGFIGSCLTEYLIDKNYEIYLLVIPYSSKRENILKAKNVHVIKCYYREYENIVEMLPKNPVAFFHFAWAGVSPESRNSFEEQKINIDITLNALKLAKLINAEKFIFPGSTMEYSFSNHIINSNAVASPQNAYGAIKISCRYLCETFCKDLSMNFIYAVISSVYSEKRIDNNVIYYTINTLLEGNKPKLTKLEQLWDYIHVDDLMRAFELLILKGKNDRFYSIGHGDNWPLSTYIYKIRDYINPELELGIGEVEYSSSKVPMSCVDLTVMEEDTGFVPNICFDDGIKRVIEKIKERKK